MRFWWRILMLARRHGWARAWRAACLCRRRRADGVKTEVKEEYGRLMVYSRRGGTLVDVEPLEQRRAA